MISGLNYNGNVGGILSAITAHWSLTYTSGNHHTTWSWSDVESVSGKVADLKYKELGDYFTFNVSNNRKNCSWVFGHGNYLTGLAEQYYLEDGTRIADNTNLNGYYDFTFFDDFYTQYGGKSGYANGGAKYTYGKIFGPSMSSIVVPKNNYGSVLGITAYDNFLMTSYWVPVPKGLWYKWHNKDLQIPENGWFDIITGAFKQSVDSVIYTLKQTNGEGLGYDYFENWDYNTSDIDYIVSVANGSQTYEQPDIHAIKTRTLASGLVFPVSKLTADIDNRVIGEWYFSGDQWLQSADTHIHAGTFDKTKLTKLQQGFCLVKPADSSEKYYVYLDPSAVGKVGEKSDAVYGSAYIETAFYNYVDANGNKFFFDGAYWVPEKYTSFNTTELNKNYAIIPDNLPIYSYPINDTAYQISTYHYGERITVPYVATQDPEWGYTGIGWIRINSGTVSEIL